MARRHAFEKMVVCPRFFLLAISALVLASCSATRVAYDNADTMLRFMASSYLDLDAGQSDDLAPRIVRFPVAPVERASRIRGLVAEREPARGQGHHGGGRRVGARQSALALPQVRGKSGRRRGTGARDARARPARGARA